MSTDKAFDIVKIPKTDRYQRYLTLMVYIFFDKKSKGGVLKGKYVLNQQLAENCTSQLLEKHKTFEMQTEQICS